MPKLTLKIIIFCLLLLPATSFGWQQYVRGGDVEIKVTPNNPGPNQEVKVELRSYAVDLDHSDIAWAKDGQSTANGYGLKTFSFRTGNTNSKTSIGAIITPAIGSDNKVEVAILFEPLEVELLWRANSYTPYWYTGKALPASEANITASAMIRMTDEVGVEIPPEYLVYDWKLDDKTIVADSGVGKSTMTFRGAKQGGSNKVSVTISNADHSSVANASTVIDISGPEIVFYEDRPLVGVVWQKSLGAEAGIGERMIIRAEPFFFSDKSKLSFDWSLNGDKVRPDEKNPARVLLQTVSKNISSRISLSLSHPNKLLQEANQSLLIKSGNGNSNGSF